MESLAGRAVVVVVGGGGGDYEHHRRVAGARKRLEMRGGRDEEWAMALPLSLSFGVRGGSNHSCLPEQDVEAQGPAWAASRSFVGE